MRNKKPLYLCLKMLFISVQTGLVYEEKMMRKKILYPLLIIAEIIAAFLYYSVKNVSIPKLRVNSSHKASQGSPRFQPWGGIGTYPILRKS